MRVSREEDMGEMSAVTRNQMKTDRKRNGHEESKVRAEWGRVGRSWDGDIY